LLQDAARRVAPGRLATAVALVIVASGAAGAAPGSACVGRYALVRARGPLVDPARGLLVPAATSPVIDPACAGAPVTDPGGAGRRAGSSVAVHAPIASRCARAPTARCCAARSRDVATTAASSP